MSILTIAQEVAKRCGLAVPTSFVSGTDRVSVELVSVINDAAQEIAEGYDWQILRNVATITGDGSTEAFDLPSDYDRMLVKSQLWSSSLETPLTPIPDHDRWLGLDVQSFDFVINAWTLYGGQIRIKPELATGVTVQYFYVSDKIYADSGGTAKSTFNADGDTFRIDERLLELMAIWRWKASKGQMYAEEMQDAERRKERLIARDKGSRELKIGRVRTPHDATIAYPTSITG